MPRRSRKRRVILIARRAAFVAAFWAGPSATHGQESRVPGDCELASSDEAALALMDASMRDGRPELAAQVALARTLCGGDADALRRKLAEIEAKSARVIVRLSGVNLVKGRLEVAGIRVGEARWRTGFLVAPGDASLTYVTQQGQTVSKTFGAIAGELVQVDIDAPTDLQPTRPTPRELPQNIGPRRSYAPPSDRPLLDGPDLHESGARMGGGVILPFYAMVPWDPDRPMGGAGGRVLFLVRFDAWGSQSLFFDGDFSAAFLSDDRDQLVMVGTTAGARFHFNDFYGLGAGLGVGYLADVTEDGATGVVQGAVYFGAYGTPAIFRWSAVQLEVRVAMWLAQTNDAGVIAVRPALIMPTLSVTLDGQVAP